MWAAPMARRQGVGAALVAAVVAWAAGAGLRRVTLWAAEDNAAAIALYETQGFRRTGEAQPLPSNPALTEIKMEYILQASR